MDLQNHEKGRMFFGIAALCATLLGCTGGRLSRSSTPTPQLGVWEIRALQGEVRDLRLTLDATEEVYRSLTNNRAYATSPGVWSKVDKAGEEVYPRGEMAEDLQRMKAVLERAIKAYRAQIRAFEHLTSGPL